MSEGKISEFGEDNANNVLYQKIQFCSNSANFFLECFMASVDSFVILDYRVLKDRVSVRMVLSGRLWKMFINSND